MFIYNIFEIVLKKCEVIVQKSLSEKKYFQIKNSQTPFCCLYVELAIVKIWVKTNKFPLSFSSLIKVSPSREKIDSRKQH